MVCHMHKDTHGLVIESGPGTGVFTQVLLDTGLATERLILLERDASFAQRLREVFPHVRVLEGDAQNLKALLCRHFVSQLPPVTSVISGLPLMSMPRLKRYRIVRSIMSCLAPDGVYVQFVYGPVCPLSSSMQQRLGLRAYKHERIWRNVPPARVWTFTASAMPYTR